MQQATIVKPLTFAVMFTAIERKYTACPPLSDDSMLVKRALIHFSILCTTAYAVGLEEFVLTE